MTLFAVWATDGEGKLPDRERVRPAHRARLRTPGEHRVKVVLAGPTFNTRGRGMNGTLLVVEADELEVVQAFVSSDPYVAAGVYQSFEIRPFVCGLGPWAPDGGANVLGPTP
jgi:uncharacterized protein YciI